MNSNKIPDITIIENSKKKKRNKNNLNEEKCNLFTIIDNIIAYEFPNNNNNNNNINNNNIINKESNIDYIKNNLIDFIEKYINLNRHFKNLNIINSNKNHLINSIIDDLLKDIVFRCEINNISVSEFKEIEIVKKNKEKIESIDLIN